MRDKKNILIIRLSAIGDVVFSTPIIGALRRTYPDARISWLIEPMAEPLLKNNKGVDELIIWPKAEWKKLWREGKYLTVLRKFWQFRKLLQSKHFDLVLDMQGLMKSGIWAWLSGAPERIALGSKEGSQYLMSKVLERHDHNKARISSEYLDLALFLELDVADFHMDVALDESDEAYAAEFKAQGEYLVICPFTTRPQKHWVEERWPPLASALMERFSMPIVMLGGPGDIEAAERIIAGNEKIINLVGKSSITQTAAVIKYASLLTGVDTGLTHMGIAFNVPTVAIFGSTCPYTDTTRENAMVLYEKMECSPCHRSPSCDADYTCMKKISIEDILQVAPQLMSIR